MVYQTALQVMLAEERQLTVLEMYAMTAEALGCIDFLEKMTLQKLYTVLVVQRGPMALVETGCLVVALTAVAEALTAVAVERTFLGVIIDLGPEAGLTRVAMGLTGVAAVLMAY
jgi:hypothetical protein